MVSTFSRRRHSSRISAPVTTSPSLMTTGVAPFSAVLSVIDTVMLSSSATKNPCVHSYCRWDEGFPPRYHPAWPARVPPHPWEGQATSDPLVGAHVGRHSGPVY